MLYLVGALGFAVLFVVGFFITVSLRRVVTTNEVHIVQSGKKTISYGGDAGNGNTYYAWPSWLPVFGVSVTKLPTSVFSLNLTNYEAYDKGRLPFVVDIMAFFRISDSNVSAQRVAHFEQLNQQLLGIVQGAVRTILAKSDIDTIMQERATFGHQFTMEVEEQLKNWGVCAVKNIELMDIRDHAGSVVIQNIMNKRKSHIEMESRTEVAKNMQAAMVAEINAKQGVDLQKQSAEQSVGLRTIENQRQVQISQQEANQAVQEAARLTKEKEMAVLSVSEVRKAEILKQVTITQAQQEQESTVLIAEGQLGAKRRESEAIVLEGQARAEAAKALQLAPVQAQITLAKEIGENLSYQQYLITIRQVEANQAVGIEQAKALTQADVKIISNTGTPTAGITDVMDLFSSKGGQAVGAMLEGLTNTPQGEKLANKVLGNSSTTKLTK